MLGRLSHEMTDITLKFFEKTRFSVDFARSDPRLIKWKLKKFRNDQIPANGIVDETQSLCLVQRR